MPTVTLSKAYLLSLLGVELTDDEITEAIERTKMSLERIQGDEMEIEVTTDRIDMLSPEGIARYLKGLLSIEEGFPRYKVFKSEVEGTVDSSVLGIRPGFGLAVVKGLNLEEEGLVSLMRLQEKLDGGWGRRRRKVSIGVHDLDKLVPPITYSGDSPDLIRFLPLGENVEMSGRDVMTVTKKGREYGHVVAAQRLFPVLRDSTGAVISLPPIINSEMTRMDGDTRNVLIDVTGTSQFAVEKALVIVATSLAEVGDAIGSVKVIRPEDEVLTPDLEPRSMELDPWYFRLKSGLDLKGEEVADLLKKARLGSKLEGGKVVVLIPTYRIDFLHPIDLVEEALVVYGYDRLGWEMPNVMTIGRIHRVEKISRRARNLLVGLGYQETMSYIMTNPQDLFEKLKRRIVPVATVANPVSATYTVLRDSLLPGLMSFLARNAHVSYPQRIFEVGDVVVVDEREEVGARNERRAAAALADDVVGFEDIQSHLNALLDNLGVDFKLKPMSHPVLIEGRSAEVIYCRGEAEVSTGLIGEVKPEVLLSLGLKTPVGIFETALEAVITDRYPHRGD